MQLIDITGMKSIIGWPIRNQKSPISAPTLTGQATKISTTILKGQ